MKKTNKQNTLERVLILEIVIDLGGIILGIFLLGDMSNQERCRGL